MTIDYEAMLRKFHEKFNHYIFFGYTPDPEISELRYKLIDEEVNKELLPILQKFIDSPGKIEIEDYVELADALADSLYVIFGTCISHGIPINEVFAEVQRSNMTKSMEKDTKSIKGKTIKGPNYEPPDIKEIIKEHLMGYIGG